MYTVYAAICIRRSSDPNLAPSLAETRHRTGLSSLSNFVLYRTQQSLQKLTMENSSIPWRCAAANVH